MYKTRFYRIWSKMKERCSDSKRHNYSSYGGRGITICDKWLRFVNFRDDMYENYLLHIEEFGESQTSIDRIDNDGNYELSNCKWSTNKEQGRNTTRNHFVTFEGKILCISNLAERFKINPDVLNMRIVRGWDIKRALITPVQKKYPPHNTL